jgi:hypothetical protein
MSKQQGTGVLDSEGAESLKRMLDYKADREELAHLHEVKCNKVDSELIKDVQIMMSKQFK